MIAFKRSPLIELNAVIGNLAALAILMFLGFLIFKSLKSRVIFLTVVTLLLNVAIFTIGIFTKYYQTMFSIYELTLFYNPAQALANSILIEAFKELFSYYRIIVFIPVIVLGSYMTYLFVSLKDNKQILKQNMYLPKQLMLGVMLLVSSVIISLSTLGAVKVSMDDKWPITAERPLYGVQSAGLYNYYLGQFFGFDFW